MTEYAPTPAHDPGRASHAEVRRAVRELSLATQAYVSRVSHAEGLHDADVHAVGVVKAAHDSDRPVSPGELGRTLALSPAAVTALLDRMERSDHVRRTRSTTDARRVEVAMTEHAEETTHLLFDPLVEAYDERLARCTDEELAVVVRVLDDLRAATAQAAARPRPPR